MDLACPCGVKLSKIFLNYAIDCVHPSGISGFPVRTGPAPGIDDYIYHLW